MARARAKVVAPQKGLTDEQLVKAIFASKGNVTQAAKMVKVDRSHFYQLIHDNPELQAALDQAREIKIDHVETRLDQLIDSMDEHVAFKAVQFFLNTQGRRRGYGNALDLTSDGKPLQGVVLIPATDMSTLQNDDGSD